MKGNTSYPASSEKIELLFQEYFRRYKELRNAEKKEKVWFVCTLIFGTLSLYSPLNDTFFWAFPVLLVITLFFIYKYVQFNKKVEHIKVNVIILEHHLKGKIEIGFCQHEKPCRCAEEFRQYIWKHYQISLY